MFGNSKKRSRLEVWKQQTRLARLGSPDERSARLRSLSLRLGLGLLTVLLISLIAYAGGGNWGPPFAFREGEIYHRDIRVKIDFTVVDEPATQLRRELAAGAIHPILKLDPAPLNELEQRLTQLLLAARAGSFNELDPDTVRYWSLTVDELRALSDTLRSTPPEEFYGFLTVVPLAPGFTAGLPEQVMGAMAYPRLHYPNPYLIKDDEDLRNRIRALLTTLEDGGILDDLELQSQPILREAKKFTLVRSGKPNDTLDDIQILKSKLIGDPKGKRGTLDTQFQNAFKNKRIADQVFLLVVGDGKRPSRLPATLKFDPDATQLARQAAIAAVPETKKEYKRGAPLIEQGRPVKEEDIPLLREEHKAYLTSMTWDDHLRRWFSIFLVVAMLGCFVAFHMEQTLPHLAEDVRRLAVVCGLIIVTLGLAIFVNHALVRHHHPADHGGDDPAAGVQPGLRLDRLLQHGLDRYAIPRN